jgi:hypothetical protein
MDVLLACVALRGNLSVFVHVDYIVGCLYCLTYGAAPLVLSQTFTVRHAAQCSLLFHFDTGDGACVLFQDLEIAVRSLFTVLKLTYLFTYSMEQSPS